VTIKLFTIHISPSPSPTRFTFLAEWANDGNGEREKGGDVLSILEMPPILLHRF
jgi:hypothetical protein